MVDFMIVLGFRGEETHGFYVLSILGAREMYARSLQSRDREMEKLHSIFTLLQGFSVKGENGAKKPRFSYSGISHERRKTADEQGEKGVSDVAYTSPQIRSK